MICNTKEIKYKFQIDNKSSKEFIVGENTQKQKALPYWAKLEFNKCPKCSLEQYQFCPAINGNIELLEYFSNSKSYDEVKVIAENIEKNTSLENALSSIFSVSMLASDCPVLGSFKNIACSFLPFLTYDVLLSSITGCDEFSDNKSIIASIDGVRETLKILCRRIGSFSNGDANKNALTRLDSYFMRIKAHLESARDK
ncbi:DUF6901 family protein [Elusimicrobiota bacterium]